MPLAQNLANFMAGSVTRQTIASKAEPDTLIGATLAAAIGTGLYEKGLEAVIRDAGCVKREMIRGARDAIWLATAYSTASVQLANFG